MCAAPPAARCGERCGKAAFSSAQTGTALHDPESHPTLHANGVNFPPPLGIVYLFTYKSSGPNHREQFLLSLRTVPRLAPNREVSQLTLTSWPLRDGTFRAAMQKADGLTACLVTVVALRDFACTSLSLPHLGRWPACEF